MFYCSYSLNIYFFIFLSNLCKFPSCISFKMFISKHFFPSMQEGRVCTQFFRLKLLQSYCYLNCKSCTQKPWHHTWEVMDKFLCVANNAAILLDFLQWVVISQHNELDIWIQNVFMEFDPKDCRHPLSYFKVTVRRIIFSSAYSKCLLFSLDF